MFVPVGRATQKLPLSLSMLTPSPQQLPIFPTLLPFPASSQQHHRSPPRQKTDILSSGINQQSCVACPTELLPSLLRCTAVAIPAPCAHDLLYLCKITNLDCYFPFALLENNWFVHLDSLISRVFPILGFLESVAVFISCLPSAEEKEKKNSFVTTSHRSSIHFFSWFTK
jgi:hypothetical protein